MVARRVGASVHEYPVGGYVIEQSFNLPIRVSVSREATGAYLQVDIEDLRTLSSILLMIDYKRSVEHGLIVEELFHLVR